MTRLKGKVALVTGGGSGIGRGICHRFATDQADVVVNDIEMKSIEKVSKELESLGARALGICADVSLKSSVEEMVSRIIKEWNKIDILVNWAGIARISPLMETTEEEFDRVYQVNLKGPFLCTQIAAKEMIKRGGKNHQCILPGGKKAGGILGGLWIDQVRSDRVNAINSLGVSKIWHHVQCGGSWRY